MILFDKLNEENLIIETPEVDFGSRTTSELRREYSELGTLKTWLYGSQEADSNGNITSRTYAELEFDTNAKDFDFNDAGFDDEVYGGQYFWRVIQDFTEKEYYSNSDVAFENFKIWEFNLNKFQLEIIYKHEILSTLRWTRPCNVQNQIGNDIGTPEVPNIVYSCPLGGVTLETPTETGDSDWFSIARTSYNGECSGIIIDDGQDNICQQYLSLNKSFRLVFDSGKALGAVIRFEDITPDRVFTASSPTEVTPAIPSNNLGSFNDPIRMAKRYLVLEWDNPGKTDLKAIEVDFYAVEFYRSFLPLFRDQDPELLEHSDTIPYIAHTTIGTPTRYKPPGRYDFPDTFWNDITIEEIEDYGTRIGIQPNIV